MPCDDNVKLVILGWTRRIEHRPTHFVTSEVCDSSGNECLIPRLSDRSTAPAPCHCRQRIFFPFPLWTPSLWRRPDMAIIFPLDAFEWLIRSVHSSVLVSNCFKSAHGSGSRALLHLFLPRTAVAVVGAAVGCYCCNSWLHRDLEEWQFP